MATRLEQSKPNEISDLALYRRAKALSSLASLLGHIEPIVIEPQHVYQTLLQFRREDAENKMRSDNAIQIETTI